jgi:hypothetical protein
MAVMVRRLRRQGYADRQDRISRLSLSLTSEFKHRMGAGISSVRRAENEKTGQLSRSLAQQIERRLYGAHISRGGVVQFNRQEMSGGTAPPPSQISAGGGGTSPVNRFGRRIDYSSRWPAC